MLEYLNESIILSKYSMGNYLHIRYNLTEDKILFIEYSNTRNIKHNIEIFYAMTTINMLDCKYCLALMKYTKGNIGNNIISPVIYDVTFKCDDITKIKEKVMYNSTLLYCYNLANRKIRTSEILDILNG